MTRRASGRSIAAKARSSVSAPLRGVSFDEQQHDRRVAEAVRGAEARAVRGRVELALVDRVRQERDARVRHAERDELPPFGVADREHAGGALEIAAPGRGVEDPLGGTAPLDDRRGAVRRDDVGNACGGEQAGGGGDRQVAAGVQVADVDARQRRPQGPQQAERREQLPAIGQGVREVAEQRGRRAGRALCGVCGTRTREVASQASVVQTVTSWPRRASPCVSVVATRGMPPYAQACS